MRCFFAALPGAGPCDGRLVRVHLIPKQLIRREAQVCEGETLKQIVDALVVDGRAWVWGCGGPTGIGGHHGMLDHSRTLRVPRAALPPALEAFAGELGLGWWLDREYGPVEAAA